MKSESLDMIFECEFKWNGISASIKRYCSMKCCIKDNVLRDIGKFFFAEMDCFTAGNIVEWS